MYSCYSNNTKVVSFEEKRIVPSIVVTLNPLIGAKESCSTTTTAPTAFLSTTAMVATVSITTVQSGKAIFVAFYQAEIRGSNLFRPKPKLESVSIEII